MRLKHLSLSEFKQHRKFDRDLDNPVVGITGLNHSGKTTILRALRWLMTGKLDGKQEHHVYGYGLKGPTTAQGSLTFEKGGQEGTITRTCGASSKRTLVWDGVSYTKAADVDEKMSEIFGADIASVDRVMFIRQGELASALFGTPSDRERLFVTILDVGYLAKSAEALEEKIRAFEESAWSGGAELIEALREHSAYLENELRDCSAKHRSISHSAGELRALQELRTKIQQRTKAESAVRFYHNRINQLKEQTALSRSGDHYRAELKANRQARESIEQELERHNQSEKIRTERIRLAEDICNLRARRDTLLIQDPRLASLTERAAQQRPLMLALKPTGPARIRQALTELPITTNSLDDTVKQLAADKKEQTKLQAVLSTAKDSLDTLLKDLNLLNYAMEFMRMKQGGACDCPMCGTPGTKYDPEEALRLEALIQNKDGAIIAANDVHFQTESDIRACNGRIAVGENTLRTLGDRIRTELALIKSVFPTQSLEECGKELQEYEQLTEELAGVMRDEELRLKQLGVIEPALEGRERSLDSLGEVAESDLNYQDIRNALTQLEARAAEMEDLCKKAEQQEAAANEARQTAVAAMKDLKAYELEEEQAAKDIDPAFALQCRTNPDFLDTTIVAIESSVREARELDGAIQAYRKQLEETRLKFEDACAKSVENDTKQAFIDRMKGLRDIFKKGALPTAYVDRKFGELCEASKEFLGRTDATFEIERDPETPVGFIFRELDEDDAVWQPQESLSGGQRVRLSIAFLIAVQQVLIPDLGLLILDEPSQHVDEPGVESLQELLSGIGQLLSDAGSQIIVCDHNEKLTPAYGTHIPTINHETTHNRRNA